MTDSPRSPDDSTPFPHGPKPYPLDTTFVRCLKAALHERDPKKFFPHLAHKLAQPGEISALDRFFRLIPQMPDLYRHNHLNYSEALNEALRRINTKLTEFECNWETETDMIIRWRFIKWLNGKLRYTVKDLYRNDARVRDMEPLSLDYSRLEFPGEGGATPLGETISLEKLQGVKLSGLEHMIDTLQRQNTQRKGLLVELYIEQDPDATLQSCHARKSTWLNCQKLAKKMFLRLQGGKVGQLQSEKKLSWRSLAEQLEVNEQTVHSHWKRRCLPLLRKIAQKIEQESEFYAQRLLGPDANDFGPIID